MAGRLAIETGRRHPGIRRKRPSGAILKAVWRRFCALLAVASGPTWY